MRLKNLLTVAVVIAGWITGAVWCAGSCCGSMDASPSPLSIGAVPCCGTTTQGGCETTMHRADDAAAAPAAPSLPPVALSGHGVAPMASILPAPISIARPLLPRPDLVRLDVPLLI